MHATWAAGPGAAAQPSPAAVAEPALSAAATVRSGATHGPLSVMARWNRPPAVGEARLAHTLRPPADSPKMLTLPASPPNRSMLRRTHRSAACWSSRPALPDDASRASALRPGRARKPNGPSR